MVDVQQQPSRRQQKQETRKRKQEARDTRLWRLELRSLVTIAPGLKVNEESISYKREGGGSIAGARAMVETAGDIDRRITATRVILTGPFALGLRKKKDNRELYLTVEGDGFMFVAPIEPKDGLKARQLAAKINELGARAAK